MLKASQQQFVINEKGKKMAIVISMTDYQGLMEDLHDFAKISERKNESTISLEKIKAKFKK